MKNIFILIILTINTSYQFAQNATPQSSKLVIGLVIDQMRWDFLQRYQERYSVNGGFKTLLGQGFSCNNTHIPYIPTVTACGHASIYSGTTPAFHGIIGNSWYDNKKNKIITSVDDDKLEKSPINLWSTTIGDQLKMRYLFKSKTFSVSLKDRSAILPGGHACNTAFWWDTKKGTWRTSAYYKNVPAWFAKENVRSNVDSFYEAGWAPLYPINTYVNSAEDAQKYEQGLVDKKSSTFNYKLNDFKNSDYSKVMVTPYGIALTLDFAKTIIANEHLGFNPYKVPDMISISIASTDLIGHQYGPHSIETEDTYLRLDKYLGDFISYLDKNIGRANYVLFLTADHGVSPVPEYLEENNIKGGRYNEDAELNKINAILKEQFKADSLIIAFVNAQFYINHKNLKKNNIQDEDIIKSILEYYNSQENVLYAFECKKYNEYPMPYKLKEQFIRGYNPKNSGEISIIFKPFNIATYVEGMGTTHGAWNSYDNHIPLIWFGGDIAKGKTYKEYSMSDIATTLCAYLNIEAPSASSGGVIVDIVK